MKAADYLAHDGLGLAELVRSRKVTPRELGAAALAGADSLGRQLGALAEIFPDEIEKFETSAASGPFCGVPFLTKDLGAQIAGRRNEFGSRLAAGLVPASDSELAKRYKAAGFLILGRTKSPEMGFNMTTENIFHGPVHNPWMPGFSAGGSSGGAAAAVAAGIVPLAHGNDGGGSIRIPASCCGVFGLKPTRGRVSMAPDVREGLNGLAADHVLSRTVRDSAAALDATQGAAPGDPYVISPPVRPYLEEIRSKPKRLRIAVAAAAWNGGDVSPDCRMALWDTARLCEDLGHVVVEARPELGVSWEAFVVANARVWCSNMAHWIDGLSGFLGRPIGPEILEATTLACHDFGKRLSATELHEALDIFNLVSRSVAPFFGQYDILLTPTLPQPPQPHGTFNAHAAGIDALAWTTQIFDGTPFTPIFNVTGQPAMSVPLAESSGGLPVGMQFAARFGDEATLFKLARQLEVAQPWGHRYIELWNR